MVGDKINHSIYCRYLPSCFIWNKTLYYWLYEIAVIIRRYVQTVIVLHHNVHLGSKNRIFERNICSLKNTLLLFTRITDFQKPTFAV